MKTRFAAPVGLALALLIAPAAAATERVAIVPGLSADSPQLVGSQVAWQQVRCLRDCPDDPVDCSPGGQVSGYRVQLGAPGRPARTLFRKRLECAQSGPNFGIDRASALVSARRLALLDWTFSGDEVTGDSSSGALLAGPRRGPLARIYRCDSGSSELPLVALEGDLLAYDTTPCEAARHLALRDLATGETRPLPHPPASITAISLSGRNLAYVTNTELAVYDHVTGARIYGSPAPAGTRITGVALDAQGRAAIATQRADADAGTCDARALTWLSAAEPQPHPLPGEPCGTHLAFDNDEIVYETPRDVRSVTLDGTHGQVAFFGDVEHRAFDYDGARVALATRTCSNEMAVYRHRLDEYTFLAGQARCEARIATSRLRARQGRAGVTLRCPRACTGAVVLRAGRWTLGARPFGSRRRGAKTVRVPLNARGRAMLRRGPVRVTIVVGVRDRDYTRNIVRRTATLR